MAEPARRLATYADLEAVADHLVAEIIDGTLETHPRPRPKHAVAASRLGGELHGPFYRGRGGPGGWTFMTEPETAFIETPPDWVCEILSPSTARLDRGPKRRIYAEAAVGHLWLLDPTDGVLEAFALTGDRWLLLGTVQRGEAVALAPFDAVSFPLDDLFAFDDPAIPATPET